MTGPQNPDTPQQNAEHNYSAADLREARRKARKLGLNPKNGLEAAKMLSEKGVEFSASKAPAQSGSTSAAQPENQPSTEEKTFPMVSMAPDNLPMKSKGEQQLPAVQSREERQKEIEKLQTRMSNKRMRRLKMMMLRVFFFIGLPTLLFAYYQYKIATPLYSTNAEMTIETSVGSEGAGATAAFDFSKLIGDEDAVGLQNFMESGIIFEKLEAQYDLPKLFMGESIDRFSRIEPNASKEERYKTFKKYVISTYDTTERLLKLEVKTPKAEDGLEISKLLIKYAEEQMDNKSDRVQENQLERAEKALQDEQLELEKLKKRKLDMQRELEGSPDLVAANQAIQAQLLEQQTLLRLANEELRQLESNPSPNQIRVKATRDKVNNIEIFIDNIMKDYEQQGSSGKSTLELETDVIILDSEIAAKVAAIETQRTLYTAARASANEQKKFLTTSLPPNTSFEPVYPKKLFSVLAVFFILFSIYLFIGMTIDVIREQMSS